MKQSFTFNHNIRKSFGKIPDLVDMPNLLEIQKNSYELFLQKDVKPEEREDTGLQAVFNKVFPLESLLILMLQVQLNLINHQQFFGYQP